MAPNMGMTVNVSLCGSVPRDLLLPSITKKSSFNDRFNESTNKSDCQSVAFSEFKHPTLESVSICPLSSTLKKSSSIHIPEWACPAKGDSFLIFSSSPLQPIQNGIESSYPVDLTQRPYLTVGRSSTSDIVLLNGTSSRYHAFIFHHVSGACFVIDRNSAHGTYLNGVKVLPYPNPPTRVRHGAIIRFGDHGSPEFMLKSFSVTMEKIMHNLEYEPESNTSDSEVLLKVNTRLNALSTAQAGLFNGTTNNKRGVSLIQSANDSLKVKRLRLSSSEETAMDFCPNRLRTTSSDSTDTFSFDISQTLTPTLFLDNSKLLKKRKVRFSDQKPTVVFPPSVTPDELSEDGLSSNQGRVLIQDSVPSPPDKKCTSLENLVIMVPRNPPAQ